MNCSKVLVTLALLLSGAAGAQARWVAAQATLQPIGSPCVFELHGDVDVDGWGNAVHGHLMGSGPCGFVLVVWKAIDPETGEVIDGEDIVVRLYDADGRELEEAEYPREIDHAGLVEDARRLMGCDCMKLSE